MPRIWDLGSYQTERDPRRGRGGDREGGQKGKRREGGDREKKKTNK